MGIDLEMDKENFLVLGNEQLKQKIVFSNEIDWIIEFSDEGIRFNREAFPDYTPDKFAQEFLRIIEYSWDVKFIRNLSADSNELF